MTLHYNRSSEKAKRKVLRNNATEAERKLWQYLKGKQLCGVKFRRQYSVDSYVLDFYAPSLKLGIEIDGASHYTAAAREYDADRTRYIGAFGIRIVRFTNADVYDNIDGVLERLVQQIEGITYERNHPQPPPLKAFERRGLIEESKQVIVKDGRFIMLVRSDILTRVSLTLVLLVTLSVAQVPASESGKADWPRWRGKNYDGKIAESDIFKAGYGLKVRWKKALGSGYSSISIADGRAVTMYSDSTFDYVVALDADNGAELWRYKMDSTYVGHDGSHDGQISTPTIDGDQVFVYTIKGKLLALNAATGRELWSKDVKSEVQPFEPVYGFASSPLVVGDILYCQVGGTSEHTVCGFKKETGALAWSATSDTVNYQSPIFASLLGEEQIIGVADDEIFGINPTSGKILWRYQHNGSNGSANPVVIGEDKIFLNQSRRESAMIGIAKVNGRYEAKELWKNRNIRQSFNTTVYHEGYLYGYSGRFITCINAESGEPAWKSRPPGDGFLILVDDHLVILTKQGTMHIAKATPEEYIEVASTKVFDGLTWSPPSFAYGRIYARNLFEIASVDIGMVDQLTLDQPEVEMLNPGGKFARFVKRVESVAASEKTKLVDEFLKQQKTSPLIEDGKYAHIIYSGAADDLAVIGDMLDAGQEQPMNRVADTDFYYLSFELDPEARLSYQIRKDFDNVMTDPMNSFTAPGGPGTLQGLASELRMPKYAPPVAHYEEPTGVRGTVETFEFESKILESARTVHAYLPPGYASSSARYPVLYVHYGNGAKDQMNMPHSIDNLRNDRSITPIIALFIESPQSFREYSRNLRDQHAQMFAEELVPHIDQKYRTKAAADSRVVMGGDEGGFAAFYTAFKYPASFHNVAGQSTHFHRPAGGDALKKIIQDSDALPINIYMDWGKYDLRYNNGLSWIQLNTEAAKFLKKKGYAVAGGQVADGFGWASWRTRTDKILEHFFSQKKTLK